MFDRVPSGLVGRDFHPLPCDTAKGQGMPAKRSGRRTAKTEKDEKEIPLKIAALVSESTPFYYSNNVTVAHTRYDVVLTFARIPTSLSAQQRQSIEADKTLSLEAEFQVAISPQLLPGLLRALDDQKEKYEERFGRITSGDGDDRKA